MTPPVFSHGSLRLYLLMLLDEQPRHGYELIQALSDRFGGTYVPSAGTIYPRLAKLEAEGLVTKQTDGRKSVYAITDAGRAELEARQGDLHSIENELTDSVRRLADEVRAGVNQAMKSLRADLASAARDAKREAFGESKWAGGGFGTSDAGSDSAGARAGSGSDSEFGTGGGTDAGPGADSGTDSGSETAAGARSSSSFSSSASFNASSEFSAHSDARESREGGGSRTSEHLETSRALHDADVTLTRFRQELRTELRKRALRGNVPRASVELLQRRLAEVRAEVLATLTDQP